MGKIGRNQPCPCGSGRKYKHCCLPAQRTAANGKPTDPVEQMKVSLMAAIEKIQAKASEKKEVFNELGVFLFYSDHEGDAWLLEATESDAVQLSRGGERLEVPIDENPETIEINFSHTFAIRDRQLFLTSYADKTETRFDRAPVQQIRAAIRRLYKRYPKEMLAQMHVESDGPEAEAE
ncbi:SEC-C metal-binding domain-containing protein [Desulfobulbus sp.]|uniref:SEC-C domain-containing protein n=1 Tax=Desulfobulbus sp. TaxID=895 RepID=UPI00286F400A|nr:SEC-C metal-binding domain-containing protein [Desulfobulbus sp.]